MASVTNPPLRFYSSMKRIAWLSLAAGCALSAPTSESVEGINGPWSAATPFQVARAIDFGGCTATRISPRFALTALHCITWTGPSKTVFFYTASGQHDTALTAAAPATSGVIVPPGGNVANCRLDAGGTGCNDSSGVFADIALVPLTSTATTDSVSGALATLAWSYPGAGVAGQKVGAGNHDGNNNPNGALRQVTDTTDGDESNGRFYASTDDVDPGDSGGPYYYANRVFGVATAEGANGLDTYTLHTSVARHLDWILSSIGYHWIGTPSQVGTVYNGSLFASLQTTERVCQYACENTASCEAYNYSPAGSSCGLYTAVTGAHTQSGWRGALHYGQSTGRSGYVVAYLRSDGYSSVIHLARNGLLHELFDNGTTWSWGVLPQLALQNVVGRLTAYRRADGINAVVYRSNGGRIIEIAQVPGQGWTDFDLTSFGGQTPWGDPVAYVGVDGVSSVVFRSQDGHINELRLATTGWAPKDLTISTSTTGSLAGSDPSPFVRSDGFSSVVYRSGTAIVELYMAAGGGWSSGVPSSLATPASGGTAPAPGAQGRPFGYTRRSGTNAILYRSTTNRLIELRLESTGWKWEDITSTGQPVGGDPVARVRTDAIDSVIYRSTTSQINEVTRSPLQGWNLGAQYGAPNASTDPVVYIRHDQTDSVIYGQSNNHATDMTYFVGGGWGWSDLTYAAGEPP